MQLRTSIALAALLGCVQAPAHAFFFFLLPTGAIQNAVQGDTCVSASAKAGDKIMKDGRQWLIKETNGVSSRCNQFPQWPVIAKVEPILSEAELKSEVQVCLPPGASAGYKTTLPNVGEVEVTSVGGDQCSDTRAPISARVVRIKGMELMRAEQTDTTHTSSEAHDPITHAHIELPNGWSQQTLTEDMKSGGVVMMARNTDLDAFVQLAVWKMSGATNPADLVASKKAFLLSKLRDTEQFPTERVSAGGLPGWRFEIRGRLASGRDLKYTATFVEGDGEVVSVVAWTSAPGFDAIRSKLVAIANSVTGVVPGPNTTNVSLPTAVTPKTDEPGTLSVSSEPPKPAGNVVHGDKSASSSAERLRELNSLYKDGLITQQEYERKKKQILDSL